MPFMHLWNQPLLIALRGLFSACFISNFVLSRLESILVKAERVKTHFCNTVPHSLVPIRMSFKGQRLAQVHISKGGEAGGWGNFPHLLHQIVCFTISDALLQKRTIENICSHSKCIESDVVANTTMQNSELSRALVCSSVYFNVASTPLISTSFHSQPSSVCMPWQKE